MFRYTFALIRGRNVLYFVVIFFFMFYQIGLVKIVCDRVHILGCILSTLTTNELWKFICLFILQYVKRVNTFSHMTILHVPS